MGQSNQRARSTTKLAFAEAETNATTIGSCQHADIQERAEENRGIVKPVSLNQGPFVLKRQPMINRWS